MNRNYQKPMADVVLLNDDVVSTSTTYVDMSQFFIKDDSGTQTFNGGNFNG